MDDNHECLIKAGMITQDNSDLGCCGAISIFHAVAHVSHGNDRYKTRSGMTEQNIINQICEAMTEMVDIVSLDTSRAFSTRSIITVVDNWTTQVGPILNLFTYSNFRFYTAQNIDVLREFKCLPTECHWNTELMLYFSKLKFVGESALDIVYFVEAEGSDKVIPVNIGKFFHRSSNFTLSF